MRIMSLIGLAEHVMAAVAELEHIEKEAMERACKCVQDEARKEIGNYQTADGPFPAWPFLSDATLYGFRHQLGFWIKGKFDQGYGRDMAASSVDDPLERTGELRASIHYHADHKHGVVGSNDPIAEYQELGTPNAIYPIPPRSFLGRAAYRKAHHVAEILGAAPAIALCGQSAVRHLTHPSED